MASFVRSTTESLHVGDVSARPTRNTHHRDRDHFGGEVSIELIIDGGGSTITTGIKGDLEMPFSGRFTKNRLYADQSGSVVVDLWKDTYANFPPTDADSITASAPPTISGATKSQDTTLTGWTTAFVTGDVLRVNVDSVTSITRVTLSLTVTRS